MIPQTDREAQLAQMLQRNIMSIHNYLYLIDHLTDSKDRLSSLVVLGYKLLTTEGPQSVRREMQTEYWRLFDEAIIRGDIPDVIGLKEGV